MSQKDCLACRIVPILFQMNFQLKNKYSVKEVAAEVDILLDPEDETFTISCQKNFKVLPINISLKSSCLEGDFRFMLCNSGQKTLFQSGIIFYNACAQNNIKKISANVDLSLGIQNESVILRKQRIIAKKLKFEETIIPECCVPKHPNWMKNSNSFCKVSSLGLSTTHNFNLDPEVIGSKASLISLKGNVYLKMETLESESNNEQLKTSLGDLYDGVLATLDIEKNFTLICNGQEFYFNKTLLSMKSDVFAKIILGSSANSITITDFLPETIWTFQKVSFENEEIRKEEFNIEVLLFAQKYVVKSLMKKCEDHLKKSLSKETIFEVIKVADMIDNDQLLQAASVFFKKHKNELLNTAEVHAFQKDNPISMIKVFNFMWEMC